MPYIKHPFTGFIRSLPVTVILWVFLEELVVGELLGLDVSSWQGNVNWQSTVTPPNYLYWYRLIGYRLACPLIHY